MHSTDLQSSALVLSICITTVNRARYIGATLESILVQATNECEVVVLDGASTDDTERVVSEYMRRYDGLRYVKQDTNNGLDRDYDRVVQLARGEYCWLMTDDDLLKPGAVPAVLDAVRRDVSLIIVNADSMDLSMSKVLQRRWLNFESDRVYRPEEMDRLFVEVGDVLKYVGGIIIKRAIWLEREKERYYDSGFIYLGVIFQQRLPGDTLVLAEPVINYRTGNQHAFSSRVFEILMVNLPELVWTLALSESAKGKLCSAEPWRDLQTLLLWRGLGFYSLTEYRRLISPRLRSIREALGPTLAGLIPGVLVNAIFILYFSMTRRCYRGVWQPDLMLQAMKESRYYFRNWRMFDRHA